MTLPQDELTRLAGLLTEQVNPTASADRIGLDDKADSTAPALVQLGVDDIAILDFHGITALVSHGIASGTQAHNLHYSKELQKELGYRRTLMIANEALRHSELDILFSAFAERNLNDYVVFKGGALALTVYDQAWLRPRTDTDLLIRITELESFKQVFTQLGYTQQFAISGDYVSYQSSFGKQLVGNATINIDVHWKINNRQCLADCYSVEDLIGDGMPLLAFDSKPMMPRMEDCLLIACLHRLGHHHREERLAWLFDIHLLCERLSEHEWERLVSKAESKKLCAVTINGLRKAQRLFFSKIPERVFDALSKSAATRENSALLIEANVPERKIFLNDIASIAGLTGKFLFIVETLFPKPGYVKRQMKTNSAILAYWLRASRGLKRFWKR